LPLRHTSEKPFYFYYEHLYLSIYLSIYIKDKHLNWVTSRFIYLLHNIFFTCPHAIPAWILPRWISTPRESLGQHWNLNAKRPSSLTTHLDNSRMRSLSARPRKPFNISFQSLNGCLNTILRCLDSTFLLVSPLPALPFLKESAMPNSLKFLQSLAYVSNLTVLLRFCFRPSAGVIFFFFFCIKNEVYWFLSWFWLQTRALCLL